MNRLLDLPDRLAASYGDILALLGRLCIGALFLPDAYGKIMNFSGFAASLATRGLPFPTVWAVLAIIAVGGGSLAVLLGYRVRLGAVLLIAFVIMANATSHRFWEFQEAAAYRTQASSFWKNTALIGGLIFIWIHGGGRIGIEGRARGN
jgi:putative oxidoreductase